VRYGPLQLDVHPGEFRKLAPEELAKLKLLTRTTSTKVTHTRQRDKD